MSAKVSVSILSADFSNLGREVEFLDKSSVDFIHLDVMDGNFVQNLTFGPDFIKSIRKFSSKIFDVHLMIQNPEDVIDSYIESGADIITFHIEAVKHLDKFIDYIKSKNKKVGVSILPSTHETSLEYIMHKIDLILVMTVNPGFGGQKYIHEQNKKILSIRKMIDESKRNILLSVDGGIDENTSSIAKKFGADTLVSGSYLLKDLVNLSDLEERISKIRLG